MDGESAVRELLPKLNEVGVAPQSNEYFKFTTNMGKTSMGLDTALKTYAKEMVVETTVVANKRAVKKEVKEEPPPYTAAPVPSPPVPAAPKSREEWQIELVKAKAKAEKEKQDKTEKAKKEKEDAAEEKRKQQELVRLQKEFWDCKGKDGKKDAETIQRKKQMLKGVRVRSGHPTPERSISFPRVQAQFSLVFRFSAC